MAIKKPPYFPNEELKVPEGSFLRRANNSQVERGRYAPIILGSLIILLLLILAGLFYWQKLINESPIVPSNSSRPTIEENQEPESDTARAQTQAAETMSTSDELNAIEADIESTNLDSLDTELNAIESEVEASAQ